MPKHLDLDSWPRRGLFEFFRGYQNPYFNVCSRLDVTSLLEMLRHSDSRNVSLAYHYFALRVTNEITVSLPSLR